MNKLLASLTIVLLWAGVTTGQESEQPILPMPAEVRQAPPLWSPWNGESACAQPGVCFGDTGLVLSELYTADAAYVLWYVTKSDEAAPVGTTGPLGLPTTQVLGGRRPHVSGLSSGARLALGYWQAYENYWVPGGIRDLGVEAVFFFVGERGIDLVNARTPTIARPFFDVNNRQESAFVVAAPGLASGFLNADAIANLWGAEVNGWKNVYFNYPGTSCSVSFLAGFRFLDLYQRLSIHSVTVFNDPLPLFSPYLDYAGDTLQVFDSFSTRNRFYGPQIGIAGKWWPMEKLCLEATAKLALGVTSETLHIAGSQILTPCGCTNPDDNIVFQGGLLALASNSGRFRSNQFAQVPELDIKVSVPLTNYLTIYSGFSLLYWSRILRPADQIDRNIDITQIPNFPPGDLAAPTGLNLPSVPFEHSDLWLLGFRFGLEVSW